MPGKSSYPKFENEVCHGLEIQKLENPIKWTIHLFRVLSSLYPKEFQFLESHFIDKLYGSDIMRLAIEGGDDLTQIILDWGNNADQFRYVSSKYHLYPNK